MLVVVVQCNVTMSCWRPSEQLKTQNKDDERVVKSLLIPVVESKGFSGRDTDQDNLSHVFLASCSLRDLLWRLSRSLSQCKGSDWSAEKRRVLLKREGVTRQEQRSKRTPRDITRHSFYLLFQTLFGRGSLTSLTRKVVRVEKNDGMTWITCGTFLNNWRKSRKRRMYPHMSIEVSWLREPQVAELTLIWLFSRMDSKVLCQRRWIRESLSKNKW